MSSIKLTINDFYNNTIVPIPEVGTRIIGIGLDGNLKKKDSNGVVTDINVGAPGAPGRTGTPGTPGADGTNTIRWSYGNSDNSGFFSYSSPTWGASGDTKTININSLSINNINSYNWLNHLFDTSLITNNCLIRIEEIGNSNNFIIAKIEYVLNLGSFFTISIKIITTGSVNSPTNNKIYGISYVINGKPNLHSVLTEGNTTTTSMLLNGIGNNNSLSLSNDGIILNNGDNIPFRIQNISPYIGGFIMGTSVVNITFGGGDISKFISVSHPIESPDAIMPNHLITKRQLTNNKPIVKYGEYILFKGYGNQEDFIEIGDSINGYVQGEFLIDGKYYGGDPTLISSFTNPSEYSITIDNRIPIEVNFITSYDADSEFFLLVNTNYIFVADYPFKILLNDEEYSSSYSDDSGRYTTDFEYSSIDSFEIDIQTFIYIDKGFGITNILDFNTRYGVTPKDIVFTMTHTSDFEILVSRQNSLSTIFSTIFSDGIYTITLTPNSGDIITPTLLNQVIGLRIIDLT